MEWQFVEIPRTGSTSIKAAIGQGSRIGVRHLPASEFPDADVLISCIRDPFDRAVSLWCYSNSSERGEDIEGFRQWVRDGLPYNGKRLDETPHEPATCITRAGAWIMLPQVTWLDERVQLFRHEDLPYSLYRVCRRNRISWRQLGHQERSTRLPTEAYYDHETSCMVHDLYSRDFQVWRRAEMVADVLPE